MSCYKPLSGFKALNGGITWRMADSRGGKIMQVPCGKCVGCRLDYARAWAIRCYHESTLSADNCFLTLTFNSDNPVKCHSLDKSDFVLFMKRLRERFPERRIRFFHCGEYGEKLSRPHHHVLLFGFDFPDKYFWTIRNKNTVFRSPILEELWTYGMSEVGTFSTEAAAYVARYCLKKVDRNNIDFGDRVPEYVSMSRRPGIGAGWYDKFSSDMYPEDFVVMKNGYTARIPRFYDNKYKLTNEEDYERIKHAREKHAENNPDNVPRRLKTRRRVQIAKLKSYTRGFEDGTKSF